MLLAALGPLYWARPFGDLIYGQDSTRLFQPFSFNDSPMIPYSYLFSSTFPVPDFTTSFYIDSTLRVLGSLGAAPWLAERLVIGVFAGLAAAGAVVLLRAIDAARDHPAAARGWVVGLVVLVYVYNPFTLSVTFWHVEGWTLFLALLPWIAALVVRVVNDRTLPLRLAVVVTLIGIYLAPGAISSFAVPVVLVFAWGWVAVWTRAGTQRLGWRSRTARSILLLLVGLGIELWSFVPFLLTPNIAYTSNNYVTPENLVATYLQASSTWGPYPVLTLTALSWISHTPSAYPWIAYLPALTVAAAVFPFVLLLGARRLRDSPGALLVYAIGLSAIPFMIGIVFPIAEFNEDLLRLGGPFLILVGGFYFLAPVYLLAATAGLYETLGRHVRTGPNQCTDAADQVSRLPRFRAPHRRLPTPTQVAALALGGFLLASALPFALAEVYQTGGPNADIVSVPPSFPALASFFGTPPSGPDYYVLVLPMSDQNGVYLDLGGRQFLDTGNLLASYIPYPVLEANNGPTAASIEQTFTFGPPPNLSALLADLHVRFVVDNPFANASAPASNEAPGGAAVDYTAILAALESQIGPGTSVGRFTVFSVPDAIPLGWSTSELVGIQSPSDVGALSLVGSVTAAPPGWTQALASALWSPDGGLPGWSITPVQVTGPTTQLTLTADDRATVVHDSGDWSGAPCQSGACESNGTDYNWRANVLTAQGTSERSTERSGEFTAVPSGGTEGSCNAPAGTLTYASNGTVTGPAYVTANVVLQSPGPDNWVTLELTNGNLSLVLQAYQNGTSGPASIGLNALYRGTSFVWHNEPAPIASSAGTALKLLLTWNASTAFGSLAEGSQTAVTELAFGNPAVDATNPGFAPSAAPSLPANLTTANASVSLSGGVFCLGNASVDHVPDAKFLVAVGPGSPIGGPTIGMASSVGSSGDVRVDSAGASFVVLGYPSDQLWSGTASSGAPLTELAGAPFANVLEVGGPPRGVLVTFHFRTAILLGLEGSWFESGGLLLAVVYLTVRRSRPRVEAGPPSMPGAPPSGPPPGQAP
ncbi:MAG: hypothetical protein L3K01_02310 [Thermoplasmata archaeon]|nr:hypothetical protein [Thermoplasmata archaeon]